MQNFSANAAANFKEKQNRILSVTVKVLNNYDNYKLKDMDKEDKNMKYAAKAWKETEAFMTMFADVAAPYGIIVMYESLNHTESVFGLRIREGADLVKKINRPNLKIVFDIYHMAMEQEDIQELEYALPYVHHIHIAERVGAERRYPSDALYDYYKKLLTPVIRSGYQGAICTEAFDGDVREGAERSIDLLKKIVAEIEQEG